MPNSAVVSPRPELLEIKQMLRLPRKLLILVAGLLLLLLSVIPAAAQEAVTDNEVNDVAKELYCPVCENTPLDVCPTQACQDWRDVIRIQLAEGRSPDEIKAYFALQYGDRVLAEPPTQGFDLLVWLLPIGAVLVGGVFFVSYMRRLQQRSGDAPAPAGGPVAAAPTNGRVNVADDYTARVEQELRKKSSS